MTEPPVLDYQQALDAGVERAGGKGWNLARLHRFGFSVPLGGVLDACVYRELLSTPELARLADQLREVTAETAGAPASAARLTEIRAAIERAPLPASAEDALRGFLDGTGLGSVPIAVRSSATAEDGARTSFAGIHESVLNVTGAEAALRAVRACYASLWTPRAVAYRRRFGLTDADVACAVVLCAMVRGPEGPPAAAGVAFSCDPVTGRRDVLRISAVPGLGDALVGGTVNPEDWTVTLERFRTIVESRSGPATLTAEQAGELARLVSRVHWALSNGHTPQDVEWAFDGQCWWLLQARPVTRLPRFVPDEIRSVPVIWSNANLKDVLPGVPTLMTWEGSEAVIRSILLANLEAAGYAVPRGMETLRRIQGHAYFDFTLLQWMYYDALGITPAEIVASFGGSGPGIPIPPGNPRSGPAGRRRGLALLRLMRELWRNSRMLGGELRRVRGRTRALAARPLTDLSGPQIVDFLRELSDVSTPFTRVFQLANGSTLWYGMLEAAVGRFNPDASRSITSGLMAGGGAVVSANQGYRVADLANAARIDAQALAWIDSEDRDPRGWRDLPAESPFRAALESFLYEFGHRAVYELELANPRWNEDPTYIVDQVRHLLMHGGQAPSPALARERRRQAEAEVDGLPRPARPLVRWLAERARQASADREESKSVLVSVLEPMRNAALETGRRLVHAGMLDDAADVFHLSWVDLDAFLTERWDGRGARELVHARRERRAVWLASVPPDTIILDANDEPTSLPAVAPVIATGRPRERPVDGATLVGVPAAAGLATGPARVIRHPDEGHRLRYGDVLVPPSTDPGWTPLFLRASAIVMEVGGYISHGAIVAREYGIPAVVNVPGLLERVQDGQMLTVDGGEGTVVMGD